MFRYLVFDLDDTLFDTHPTLRSILLNEHGIHLAHDVGYLTPEIVGDAFHDVIGSAAFMRQTPLKQSLENICAWLLRIRNKYPDLQILFCTHRGYHEDASIHTDALLSSYGLDFNLGFYLCPTKEPCKIDFLNGILGHSTYVLVDDLPSKTTPALPENILVVDKPWNQHYCMLAKNRIRENDLLSCVELFLDKQYSQQYPVIVG